MVISSLMEMKCCILVMSLGDIGQTIPPRKFKTERPIVWCSYTSACDPRVHVKHSVTCVVNVGEPLDSTTLVDMWKRMPWYNYTHIPTNDDEKQDIIKTAEYVYKIYNEHLHV